MNLEEMKKKFKEYSPKVDTDMLELAFEYSENAHKDQERASGEHYFVHCSAVAETPGCRQSRFEPGGVVSRRQSYV